MGDLTPRNNFTYPSEREEPFWDSFKAGVLAEDAAMWANAENSNTQFQGGGVFEWDSINDTLIWTDTIYVAGFSTPFKVSIPGPASIEIQENEVVYFKMLRLLNQNIEVELYRSNRTYMEGVRLHDLRLFCTRWNDTIYFTNGLSLKEGQIGPVFGAGLLPRETVIPHEHEPAVTWIAPGPGITFFTPTPSVVAPQLKRIDVFKNGQLLVEGASEDYTHDVNTGLITLTVPTVVVPGPDKFTVWRETRDFTVILTSHEHAPKLVVKPVGGTTVLSALATSPLLLRIDLFRNGQLQVEGPTDDYTADLSTGLIVLTTPSAPGDKYAIQRILAL